MYPHFLNCGYTRPLHIQSIPGYAARSGRLRIYTESLGISGTKSGLTIRSSEWRSLPPRGRRIKPTNSHLVTVRSTGSNSILAVGLGENVIAENGINTSTDVISFETIFGLSENAPVACSVALGYSMPGGITNAQKYYIKDFNGGAKTARLSATPGGTQIDITSVGTAGSSGYYVRPRCIPWNQPSNITFHGIKFEAPTSGATGWAVYVGTNQQPTLEMGPNNISFDHVVISSPVANTAGAHFCLVLAAGSGHRVEDSHIDGCKAMESKESKGIWIHNTRNVLVKNNYVEAASINLLIAGGDSAIGDVAKDITIVKNVFEKPGYMMYKQGSGAPTGECYYGGGSGAFYRRTDVSPNTCANGACYTCQQNETWALDTTAVYRDDDYLNKNLLEIKDCDGCLVEGNLFRGSYVGPDAGQGGCFGAVAGFGPGFGGPYHRTWNTHFLNNWCDQTYGGLAIANGSGGGGGGFDQIPIKNVSVKNTLVSNIGRFPALSQWSSPSDVYRQGFGTSGGADNVAWENNTIRPNVTTGGLRRGAIVTPGGWTTNQITNFSSKNNIVGWDSSSGTTWDMDYAVASTGDCSATGLGIWIVPINTVKKIHHMVYFGGSGTGQLLSAANCLSTFTGNISYAANDAAMGFISATNHRLAASSSYIAAGEGGSVPGADIDLIESAIPVDGITAEKALRFQAERDGSTVTVRFDDSASACNAELFSSVDLRKANANGTEEDSVSDSVALKIRRTVTWSLPGTGWLRLTCGSRIVAKEI